MVHDWGSIDLIQGEDELPLDDGDNTCPAFTLNNTVNSTIISNTHCMSVEEQLQERKARFAAQCTDVNQQVSREHVPANQNVERLPSLQDNTVSPSAPLNSSDHLANGCDQESIAVPMEIMDSSTSSQSLCCPKPSILTKSDPCESADVVIDIRSPSSPQIPRTLSVSDKNNSQEHACIICFESIAESPNMETLKCSHKFHTECLHQWRMGSLGDVNQQCPVCRNSINSSPMDKNSHRSSLVHYHILNAPHSVWSNRYPFSSVRPDSLVRPRGERAGCVRECATACAQKCRRCVHVVVPLVLVSLVITVVVLSLIGKNR